MDCGTAGVTSGLFRAFVNAWARPCPTRKSYDVVDRIRHLAARRANFANDTRVVYQRVKKRISAEARKIGKMLSL